ncbi:MAG: PDZ domain-containing protein, partial [Pseudomonadota bacterium]
VTSGIVSALDRIGLNNDSYEDFIQTDAAINPGNSGGALLNLRGELVGINTAIISSAGGNNGIGFAIPINLASSVMTQILEYGEVRRGLLGVEISSTANRFEKDTRDEYKLGDRNGALVMAVTPDSAAEKAGIELNDIILSVNGDKTRNALELRNAIGFMAPGETASIEVLRDGRTRTVKAKLGTKASPVTTASVLETTDGAGLHEGLEGASFGELSREQARSLDGGVTVVEIERGSPAAASDLKAGDVIVKVNRKSVGTLADFRKQASNDNEQLMLTVVREGTSRLVFIG